MNLFRLSYSIEELTYPIYSDNALMNALFLGLQLALSTDPMIDRSLSIIDERYLWPEALVAQTAFVHAVKEAEQTLPWLIVDELRDAQQIQLRHGTTGVFKSYDISNIPFYELANLLEDVKQTLTNAGPIPSDVELGLVLLKGLSRTLDRYSVFLDKDSLTHFNERIRGSLSGVGARVQKGKQGALIIEVFPGGPAAEAGILAGDEIIELDGISLQGFTLSQITERLRGPVGTRIQIGFLEGGDAEDLQRVELQRAMVRVPNVHWRVLDSGIGLIEISSFSEQTTSWLTQALAALSETKGLILDLRGNSGGSMLQSCLTVDAFLKSGIALQTVGRDGQPPPRLMREYLLEDNNTEPAVPIVVLVNRKTASAAEIVSGALKLSDRAIVIGSQTYGKGLVQMPYTIRSGQSEERVMLKMTIAQYLLQDDYSVHEERGIYPDIVIQPFFFAKDTVYLQPVKNALVYAREVRDFDSSAIPERDFILDFAEALLMNTMVQTTDGLRAAAERLVDTVGNTEEEIILAAMAERSIDWRAGTNPIDEPTVELEFHVDEPIVAGQMAHLELKVTNSSTEPLFQSYVMLNTENASLPWDDQMIPFGFIPSGETLTQTLDVFIPYGSISRIDELLFELTAGQHQIDFQNQKVMVLGEAPTFLDTQLQLNYNPDSGVATLDLQLTNIGSATIRDIQAHLFWPKSAQVSHLDEDVEVQLLAPSEVFEGQVQFQFEPPLNALPDPLIQISTASVRRFIRTEISASKIQAGLKLNPPVVEGPPIVQAPTGPLSLRVHVEDDGIVQDVVAWLDEEKIGYFSGVSDVDIELDLPIGSHTLRIDAYDDQLLKSSWYRHIMAY
ncbi:MAG: S41 family peptidase [Myxococcota bacterium]